MIFQPQLEIIAETDQGSIAPRHCLPALRRGIAARDRVTSKPVTHHPTTFSSRSNPRLLIRISFKEEKCPG